MLPESSAFVWDALDAAHSIRAFLGGVSFETYAADLLRRRAVEREFEILGEALNRLHRADPNTASRIPGLRDAVGLRNVLIHGYATVLDRRVYDTAVADLPNLVAVLAVLLDAEGDR
jgi:uncharacterized protein with HEPN domain